VGRWPLGQRGDLRIFLELNELGALVLLASTLLVEGRPNSSVEFDAGKLGSRLMELDKGTIDVDKFDERVTHSALVEHVEAMSRRRAQARRAGDRDRRPPPGGVECAYNLACYYTRRAHQAESDRRPAAELWDKASARLRNAIDLGGSALGEWAENDPVLAPYRADKSRDEKLKTIVKERKDPEPTAATPAAVNKPGSGNLLEILRELVT
jgi:hypothetical protein